MKPAAIILLALLVIVAGMFLLAKTKKENLGRFFKFISFTVVILGFVVILLVLQLSILRMAGLCRDKFMHMRMNRECNKEMPFQMGDHKMMMMMNNNEMDGCNKVFKKIEIVGDDKCGIMKMDGNNMPCGMGPNCMMKMGGDKSCGSGSTCDLKCLSPEERAMIITKRISDKVTLTSEQFPKVQALILDISSKKDAMMKQNDGDPIKLEGMMKKYKQENMDALKKLLTPAQIKLLPEDFPM